MTSNNDRWFLVVDYNLSRWTDVECMRRYAAERHGLMTLLIRPNPGDTDRRIADAILDLDPLAPGFVDNAMAALQPWSGSLAAGVVFSDNAVAAGARLLRRLGLRVDDPILADAAFSKAVYRDIEARHAGIITPQGVYIPSYRRLHSCAEAEAFADECPGGFVLKPCCEGNNRGVVFLRGRSEVTAAWAEEAPYVAAGVVGEGFIGFPREYSFDGIGHLSFITEKISAHGRYPVEIGQLVPARLGGRPRALITRTGGIANLLVGQCEGPFHNEIKLDADGGKAAVIEPNRRPAGMKIWSLAERVYGVSFYQLWVESALGHLLPDSLPPAKGQAATAMLGVARDSWLAIETLPPPDRLMRQAMERMAMPAGKVEWFDFTWLAPERRSYPATPRDNGDFPAQACFYTADDGFDLHGWVRAFQAAWCAVLAECTAAAAAAMAG